MRLRNWLLTGTSLSLLTMAPLGIAAQELPQACVDAGFTTLEDCIAEQPAEDDAAEDTSAEEASSAEEAPAEEPEASEEATTSEEAASEPEAEEEPIAEPEAVEEEEPAAEPEVTEEAAPETEAVEEAAPEEEVVEEAAPETEAVEEEEPAVEEEEPAVEEAEPAADESEALEAPAAQAEDAPVADEAEESAAESETIEAADEPATEEEEETAPADSDLPAACVDAGFTTLEDCIAGQPAGESEETQTEQSEDADADTSVDAEATVDAEEETSIDAQDTTDAVNAEGLLTEPVEDLPEGVSAEQVAPVTDSGKEDEAGAVSGARQAPTEEADAEVVTLESLPEDDASAQQEIAAPEEANLRAIVSEEGERVEAEAVTAPVVPQNVTIVEQTNVTNNVVNNSTTTNTTVNNSTTNIGQQNNVDIEINEDDDGRRPYGNGRPIEQLILQVGTQLIVNSVGQDTDRFYNPQEDEIFYENLSRDRTRETITRPDGTQIVTVRNRNGDVLQRVRVAPDGREYVLAYFDDRYDEDLVEWRDPGTDLPPLRLNIPVEDYVLDAEFADENEIEVFFSQPPVEQVTRLYSIDEVKRSARVRDSVRKLEVGGLTFDTGAATISRDQVGSLATVANGMLALLEQNPSETFLIEGHSDAVGDDISNLRLSDLRAATVARILTDFYEIPPENLATQGYGERYLKIRTDAAERENRRVTIRRITPLVTVASN